MLASVCRGVSVIAVLAMSAYAFAQSSPPAVHITGVVTESRTETPIRRARIEVGLVVLSHNALELLAARARKTTAEPPASPDRVPA